MADKEPRKIVQIAVYPPRKGQPECLYALCNDGSVWLNPWSDDGHDEWYSVQAIPQDAPPPASTKEELLAPRQRPT